MNTLAAWLSKLATTWKFWCVVAPWEVGIRVRLGKRAVSLAPGPHWRIPILDQLLTVNTRERYTSTPIVTLQSEEDGNMVRCVRALVGYRITRPLKAVETYEHPSMAVMARAQAYLSQGLAAGEIETELRPEFDMGGIEIIFVRFSEDVDVPALRLMQAEWRVASEDASWLAGKY